MPASMFDAGSYGFGDGVLPRRRRHQLHQPHRALRRPRARLIGRLDLDHRAHQLAPARPAPPATRSMISPYGRGRRHRRRTGAGGRCRPRAPDTAPRRARTARRSTRRRRSPRRRAASRTSESPSTRWPLTDSVRPVVKNDELRARPGRAGSSDGTRTAATRATRRSTKRRLRRRMRLLTLYRGSTNAWKTRTPSSRGSLLSPPARTRGHERLVDVECAARPCRPCPAAPRSAESCCSSGCFGCERELVDRLAAQRDRRPAAARRRRCPGCRRRGRRSQSFFGFLNDERRVLLRPLPLDRRRCARRPRPGASRP